MQAIDRSREEQIIEWANYVRSHNDWKKIHTEFINSQFIKYKNFLKRILKTANGKKKLKLLSRC